VSTLGAWLSFTLYFGAAMHDASSAQREALRTAMSPVLQHLRSDDPEVWKPAVRNAFGVIHQVMGAQWAPQGEWARQIDLLLPKGDGNAET
jgi:hypothetical protein